MYIAQNVERKIAINMVRHILGISGGKDSAALAIYLKNKYPQMKLEYYNTDTGCELPKDLMLGAAIVTATGRHEVLISNYKGILEYEDSFIKIQTKNCRILISGSHLAIDYYTNEEMKITGFLDTIQYEN